MLFLPLLSSFFEEVTATSATGGVKIGLLVLLLQLFTLCISANSSDKTAKKVDNIPKSVEDNSSPKAIARVEARTI